MNYNSYSNSGYYVNPSIGSQPNQFGGSGQQQAIPQAQAIFPQPTGSVYNINNTLEVANVPAGAGLTVALCLPENLMYVKAMQNGNPMLWVYNITPYEPNKQQQQKVQETPVSVDSSQMENFNKELEFYRNKITALEKQIILIKEEIGGNK